MKKAPVPPKVAITQAKKANGGNIASGSDQKLGASKLKVKKKKMSKGY